MHIEHNHFFILTIQEEFNPLIALVVIHMRFIAVVSEACLPTQLENIMDSPIEKIRYPVRYFLYSIESFNSSQALKKMGGGDAGFRSPGRWRIQRDTGKQKS